MIMRKIFLILFLLIPIQVGPVCAQDESAPLPTTIDVVTEEFPPYNYTLKDKAGKPLKITGWGTEVVEAVCKQLHVKPNIQVLPWVRAMQMAKENENVLIYSISR